MHLEPNQRYQLKIEFGEFLPRLLTNRCQDYIVNDLDFINIVKCQAFGKIIEIIFNPPDEIDDEYIFHTIEVILRNAGLVFAKALLRKFVGNMARTITASATGGAIGSRGGAAGILLGLIAGAAIEKVLFDWEDICECTHDETGDLRLNHYHEEQL